jgi:flagellar hook-associated protein 3 FlgL
MRIAGDTLSSLVTAIQNTAAQEKKAFQQLSSGRRIQHASDDPAAFALAMYTNARVNENDQFLTSTQTVQSMMQSADSTLNSVVTALTRAISLGIEGASDTVSSDQRQAVAGEVLGIRDTIVSLANTAFNDTYLFGGTKSTAAPFIVNANSSTGVDYIGSTEVNQVQIGESLKIPVSIPGDQLFSSPDGDVFGSLNALYQGLMNNDQNEISTATAQARQSFDHVSSQRVFYGNSMQLLEQQDSYLNNNKVELAQEWDSQVGVDPTTAASTLVYAQQAHDSTLAAAAKVSSLSLLDYLTSG